MIQFYFENIEKIPLHQKLENWLGDIIISENKKIGDITYIFCDDSHLLTINKDFLKHDYYTDIITFDYVRGKIISADIFVSLPRILDNAKTLRTNLEDEIKRVLAHGILHLCGYKDKTEEEIKEMRSKEDFYINRF